MKEKIIIPLDVPEISDARFLVDSLKDIVGAFKVGMELFYAAGGAVLDMIHNAGAKVFLDLKLHDIPHTVANALKVLAGHNIWMTNIHISGGRPMLQAAVAALNSLSNRPLLIGVTVLTSIDQQVLSDLGFDFELHAKVLEWSGIARECGLNGVVCSPHEISDIKGQYGREFLTVVPGIRPVWARNDDQKRIMTPRQAVVNGADYLVIGRPVTKAENPRTAAWKIIEEMEDGNGHA
ncbi:MAG: orotidine-5'-phosphate decarboxylase [Bacillota bacterium]